MVRQKIVGMDRCSVLSSFTYFIAHGVGLIIIFKLCLFRLQTHEDSISSLELPSDTVCPTGI